MECHWLLEDKWKTWSFQIKRKHLSGITTDPFLLPDQIIPCCRRILRWSSWSKNTDFSYGSINPHVIEYTEKYSFVWKSSTSAMKELNAFKIWSSIFSSVVWDKIARIILSRNQNVNAVFCCVCEKSCSLFSHLRLDKVYVIKYRRSFTLLVKSMRNGCLLSWSHARVWKKWNIHVTISTNLYCRLSHF